MNHRLMVIDDDSDMCTMLKMVFEKKGYAVDTFNDSASAFESLLIQNYNCILTDLRLGASNGLDICSQMTSNFPTIPIIIMTAFGSMESAIQAIRAGAYDFITKPFDTDILDLMIQRAVKYNDLNMQIKKLNASIDNQSLSKHMIGNSQIMQKLFDLIVRSSQTDTTVMITGESGTGKELVARALHSHSYRKNKPFVAINCSAIPENLLESELFGYKKGAFTDAKTDRQGLILQADKGVLFLDEIGEIPLPLQAKLLRTLEEHSIRPLGGHEEIPFDVRIISATNRDIESLVPQGLMREDLYYRLNVIHLQVPPLRLRGNDILLLANHYLKYFAELNNKEIKAITKPAMECLSAYNWPGNVRELKNVIERSIALTKHNQIIIDDLPEKIKNYHSNKLIIQDNNEELIPMNEVEKRYILFVLEKTKNNKSLTARILGFDRKTLYNKLETYHINV